MESNFSSSDMHPRTCVTTSEYKQRTQQKMDCSDSQQIAKDNGNRNKKTSHNKLKARMTLSSLIIEHMQAHQQVKNDIAINKKDIRLKFPTPISNTNVGGMRTSKD